MECAAAMGAPVVAAMTTLLCVLRSGGEYRPEHVQWLARQVPGIVCLTDTEVPGVECIRMRHRWPGWWAKMNAYDPEQISGDMLLMDLDTVVFSLPDMPVETTVTPDFYKPQLMSSTFVFVTAEDRKRIWSGFISDPDAHMKSCRTRMRWGDQGFVQAYIGNAPRWNPEQVCSYKVNIRGRTVPHGMRVICFHGKPRPWEANESWIPKL